MKRMANQQKNSFDDDSYMVGRLFTHSPCPDVCSVIMTIQSDALTIHICIESDWIEQNLYTALK